MRDYRDLTQYLFSVLRGDGMPAGNRQYFYGAGSGTVGWKSVTAKNPVEVGTTTDGKKIYCFEITYHPGDIPKVYLALWMNNAYYYIFGTGYDMKNGQRQPWSSGSIYGVNDIRSKSSQQLKLL